MSRTSENQVKHVISFRVNEEEKEAIDAISLRYGVNISTLMRNCIHYLDADFEKRGAVKLRTWV